MTNEGSVKEMLKRTSSSFKITRIIGPDGQVFKARKEGMTWELKHLLIHSGLATLNLVLGILYDYWWSWIALGLSAGIALMLFARMRTWI